MSWASTIGKYFLNFFKALLGQLGVKISQFVHDFVQEDLGKIALDAVAYVATLGQSGTEARDAAKAKFVTDAEAAGHDLAAFGESLLNFIIETAVQAYQAGIVPPTQPAIAPKAPTQV